jgi:DtxR family Mn-dependent transcriptional regulator
MSEQILELNAKFPAAANYLSQIFFIQRDYKDVSNAMLAERLNVSKPAVTQAINRLKTLDLIDSDRYGKIRLSDKGTELAKNVVRRHFLIEHLLVKMLEYPWDLSDEEAERLQDKISDNLTDHIYEKLGRPQTCPHGNPLPGSEIEEKLLSAKVLLESNSGDTIRILRITEEGEGVEDMLSFCDSNKIQPGQKFTVEAISEESVSLNPASGGSTIIVPPKYARHIRID